MAATTYEVTYEFLSAYDIPVTSTVKGLTLEEADQICEKIESLDGYKLVNVQATI